VNFCANQTIAQFRNTGLLLRQQLLAVDSRRAGAEATALRGRDGGATRADTRR